MQPKREPNQNTASTNPLVSEQKTEKKPQRDQRGKPRKSSPQSLNRSEIQPPLACKPKHYELLELLYIEYREDLIAFIKCHFPNRPWAQCEDDVQTIFLVFAVDGFGSLGRVTIASLRRHIWRRVVDRIRRLRSIKRGGRLTREPNDVSELPIESSTSTGLENWIAVHDVALLINAFDTTILNAKEHAIWMVMFWNLPKGLSVDEILESLPEHQRHWFFSGRSVADPIYEARREIIRARSRLRNKLRDFFAATGGQSGPFAA